MAVVGKRQGPGDFVKVDCAVCDHTALLAPAFLFRLGVAPCDKVLDLRDSRSLPRGGAAVVSRRVV